MGEGVSSQNWSLDRLECLGDWRVMSEEMSK